MECLGHCWPKRPFRNCEISDLSVNEGLKSNLYLNMFPVCVEQQQNKPEENYFFYYLSFMILFVSIVLALLNQYSLDN